MIARFLDPYPLLLLVAGLAMANLWRRRREARGPLLCASLPLAALAIFSLPMSGYLALGSLEWRYPPEARRATGPQAIVVLAGNMAPPDAVRRRAELGHSTLYRCQHAADVFRRGDACPIIVSGGRTGPDVPGPSCAELMRDFLASTGIAPALLIVERRSTTTYENAVECGKLLRARGLRSVVLVTEATHMDRAARCFRKQGIAVVPSPCRHRATEFHLSPLGFIPSVSSAQNCLDALHEWAGLAWYRLNGRL